MRDGRGDGWMDLDRRAGQAWAGTCRTWKRLAGLRAVFRRTGEPGASAAAGVRCLALPCLLALLASVAEVVAVGLDLGQPWRCAPSASGRRVQAVPPRSIPFTVQRLD